MIITREMLDEAATLERPYLAIPLVIDAYYHLPTDRKDVVSCFQVRNHRAGSEREGRQSRRYHVISRFGDTTETSDLFEGQWLAVTNFVLPTTGVPKFLIHVDCDGILRIAPGEMWLVHIQNALT